MSNVTKPIILDETGQAIVEAIQLNTAAMNQLEKTILSMDLVGPPGPAYTLTETDKAEIVTAVVAALPVYNGEVADV